MQRSSAAAAAPRASATAGAAAASALGRINDDGNGALSKAFSDTDPTVRAAAYVAAGRINSFTDVATAVAVTGDSDPVVRRVGIELLDEHSPLKHFMHRADAVIGGVVIVAAAYFAAQALLSVAQSDSVDEVRLVACHALGNVGDSSMVNALNVIAQNDSSIQVQDQARIASLRLSR